MNIVFLEPLGMCACTLDNVCKPLKDAGHSITVYNDRDENEETLISRGKDAEVIIVSNIPLRKSFFDACPNIKMISVAFTGTDHIDMDECRRKNITVCNAAGYSTQAVAELAIGMIISTYRKIVGGDSIIRVGGDRQNFLGTQMSGKTIGIIGAGAIGQRVAQLAHAFGCKVIAWNRTPKSIENIRFVDKETLLRTSDIISLHIPLNQETTGFIGTPEFEMMQSHAILINTARGPIINQESLYNALRKGMIAGAATDVYTQEPPLPASSELFNAPNLLMLPHMGYATKESFAERLKIVVANVEMWLKNTPQNLVS